MVNPFGMFTRSPAPAALRRIEPRMSNPAPAPEPAQGSAAVEKNSAGSLVSSLNSLAFPQPMLYAALGGYASNSGVPVTPLTALQAAAVYGCTKIISEDIAGVGVQVQRRAAGSWVCDEEHPLNDLFMNPNRWQTPFEFWSYVVSCYCLRGNAFITISRDLDGRPIELIPVSPDRVTITLSRNGRMFYRCNSRQVGYGVVVPPDDMMHLKNFSLDGYLGVSPIACAQDVVGLALAAQQHGAILFRQGGQVSGALKFPGVLGKEATDNVAQSWRDTHTGVQNAHKVLVLEEGGTYEKLGMTNEDAQFLATREFQVVDICSRIYRVPPHKLGVMGRATYNNIEQMQQQYIDDGLTPITLRLRDLVHGQLLFNDERRTQRVVWDYTGLLRGDQLTRYQAYQIGLLNGFLNRNEVRGKENLNPVPGGNEYRVPLNTADPTQAQPVNGAQETPRDDSENDEEGNGDA
jgi:HK97 family phage portal protein